MIEAANSIMEGFDPISLGEMDAVALMKRTDTKFVIPSKKLFQFLVGLESEYKVLTINDKRVMTYLSEYFDTEKFKFYKDHHNGKVNRTKIRIRNYVESGIYFLEVKRKNGKGVTTKSRIPVESFEPRLSASSMKFIKDTTNEDYALTPSLTNSFKRITLVNVEKKERVTIDLSLSFLKGDISQNMNDLVVVELKQERFNRKSSIVRKLHSLGVKPFSVSKYCIGLASLEIDLKRNAFKRKFLTINKLLAV